MSPVDTVTEVILYAEDMDRMVAFYRDVLGLDVASGAPEHGFVAFETGTCEFCLHAGRDGDVGPYAPTVVFSVDDLDSARQSLADRGVEMSDVRSPTPDTRVCDGTDPEGNAFSIEAST
jgi:predicted enzyme related to lactoylglutathione lyase